MKTIKIVTILGVVAFTGLASANMLEVKKTVEKAQCKKLAASYAKDPSSSTIQTIAQLQMCLDQTLQTTASRAIPRSFEIPSPRPSTSIVSTPHSQRHQPLRHLLSLSIFSENYILQKHYFFHDERYLELVGIIGSIF